MSSTEAWFIGCIAVTWAFIAYFSVQMWRNLESGVKFWPQFLLQWPVYLAGKHLTARGQSYRRKVIWAMLVFVVLFMANLSRDVWQTTAEIPRNESSEARPSNNK